MKVELLVTPGCGHARATAALLDEVLRERAPGVARETVVVATAADAARLAFPGSPTIRVDGRDVEPGAPTAPGLG
jgi:hypothetical protein